MYTIGIDLGGTNIKSGLVHPDKGLVARFSLPTEADRGKDHVIARVAESVRLVAEAAPERPAAVGIGSPGVISYDRTTVSNPPNFPGWISENLAGLIEQATGFPTWVDNDANLMALGSRFHGAGKAFDSFVMITLGTGVGGGIIYQNKLFRGVTGGAAELGHVVIDYNGPSSNSPTRGGIEAYLGQRFLSRTAWETIRKKPENPLYVRFADDPDKLEPADLSEAASAGNPEAIEILRQAGEHLGVAIVNYLHVLDIRKFIVSGGVSKAGELILGPARARALEIMLQPFREGFEIIPETLGNDAALLGAGSLPREYLVS